MSQELKGLIERAESKASLLKVELPKGIRDSIEKAQARYNASLVDEINGQPVSVGAREIARGKFLLALDELTRKIVEFEKKQPREIRRSNASLLDDEALLKKALRHVELNNMAQSYKQDYERRMQELTEARENILSHIPAEQQADFKAMLTAIGKRATA